MRLEKYIKTAITANSPILPTINAASFNCNKKNRNAYSAASKAKIEAPIRRFLLNPYINEVISMIVADADIIYAQEKPTYSAKDSSNTKLIHNDNPTNV